MYKKIFSTIIVINVLLFIWQSVLSISLSTQGDVLSAKLLAIQQIRNQMDIIENQIYKKGNLEEVSRIASERGFISVDIVRFTSDNLANAVLGQR